MATEITALLKKQATDMDGDPRRNSFQVEDTPLLHPSIHVGDTLLLHPGGSPFPLE